MSWEINNETAIVLADSINSFFYYNCNTHTEGFILNCLCLTVFSFSIFSSPILPPGFSAIVLHPIFPHLHQPHLHHVHPLLSSSPPPHLFIPSPLTPLFAPHSLFPSPNSPHPSTPENRYTSTHSWQLHLLLHCTPPPPCLSSLSRVGFHSCGE